MKVQAAGEEAGEAFGMYQAKFYVILLLLPYKQNHMDLLCSRVGPFYTRLEYDPVLWLQKGGKLPPLSLAALEGRECSTWFSSSQKDTVRR